MNMRHLIEIAATVDLVDLLHETEEWNFDNIYGAGATEKQFARLNQLIVDLKANLLAPCLRIFGSATTDKIRPGDIDCIAVFPSPVRGDEYRTAMSSYLKLAQTYYGSFDPFILDTKQQLFVRNDDATGWMKAKNARKIIKAGLSGIPVLEFNRKFGSPKI